jgi:hypothetical protein
MTYYQRYTDGHGRARQFKIGPADVLTLDQARRKARSVLKQAIIGTDPQEKRGELRTVPTLAEFARGNYLPHVQTYKRSWRYDEIILRLHILPVLGRLPLDEIRQENITDLLSDMRKRGYVGATTNRVLVLLRYMFNLARKWKTPGVDPLTPESRVDSYVDAPAGQGFFGLKRCERLLSYVRPACAAFLPLALMESPRRRSQSRLRAEGRENHSGLSLPR